MQKAELEGVYKTHHEKGSRYGYLYCDGERAPYLNRWIGQGKRILDLGCRDGMLTQFFARGNEVIGVDIDRKALEIIQSRLNIETVWLDLNQEWPFEPESFDVIVACEIIEHLFILHPFLANVFNSLKKGGLFIGSVPNTFRIRNRLKFLAGNDFENDPTHVRMFSEKKLESVLSDFFGDIRIIPIQGKVLPFLPVSPKLPRKLNSLFAKDLLWQARKL
jgi:2-polyprenyl-3-methyl-5-hydroxy-6-metoxy-1,4-benzoquinol methylase